MNKRDLVEKRKDQGRKLFNSAKMLALKKGKRHPKKHGAVMIYNDFIIEVRYDTYAPNLSVYSKSMSQRVLEFHLGHIKKFIPNSWVDHLIQLAKPILLEEKLRKIQLEKERESEYLAKWGITD